MNTITDLAELSLLLELDLVEDQVPSGGGPIDSQSIVASDPLGADIRVHGNSVRATIVGARGHRQVRERNGLVEQVTRLAFGKVSYCDFDCNRKNCRFTSTGLRNDTVKSMPPAVSTKVLWVLVNYRAMNTC